jgi:hypothetical protein
MDRRFPDDEPLWPVWKTVVKRLGTKIFVMLFALLAIACAFDGPMIAASLSQQHGTFCGALDTSTIDISLPAQSAPQASSGDVMGPLPGVHPLWFLAQSIDHPPEQPA